MPRVTNPTNMKTAALLQQDDGHGNHLDAGANEKNTGSVQTAWDNADDVWRAVAVQAVTHLAAIGEPFDAFDVTELGVPEPDHPNRWGALFRAMSTAGVITQYGFHESRRPSRAGGVCRLWVGTHRKDDAA